MIIVVEGISASGKSSWCARHGDGHVIPENGNLPDAPDPADGAAAAAYWAERNVTRWQAALATENNAGLAVCDTDPLKLHYAWCLYRIGETPERDWHLHLAATRETIAGNRIGFADRYLVNEVPAEVARERARNDATRRRRRFELHLRLQPPLLQWYRALDAVLPGRVQFGFPEMMPTPMQGGARYELDAFDRMIGILTRPPA